MRTPVPDQPPTLPPAPPVSAEPETLAPSTPPAEFPAGVPTIAGYEVLGELGRGGMGVVYKARQVKLNRLVALKMILAGGHAGEADLLRFRAEAEAVARLQHSHIVQIHEVGESEGRPFFSLEFVEGGSLAARLDGTPWAPRPAAEMVRTLARAMHAAHQQGVIHRDLKPGNVLLAADGSPKITDFGLAKQLDSKQGQTASGAILGTPSYMAPEQAGGKRSEVGPAADVYALGAILYELLTGRPPFRAETPLDTILQVVSGEPVPPRRLVPKLPRDLETICLKCLEKMPAKRYGSAADLADDLDRWLNTQPIRARRIGPVGRAVRWCRRNPVLAAVCALAVLVIGTLTVLYRDRLLDENQKTRAALSQAEKERDQTDVAREEAQDTLARSLFEEARALRLAHRPGWRWQALDLLRQAVKLRARPRRSDQTEMSVRLPSRGELRNEAVAALILEDARPLPPVMIAASTGNLQISQDGRRILGEYMHFPEKPGDQAKAGLRLFDLSDGRQIAELFDPALVDRRFKALSPDGTFLAVEMTDRSGIQLLNLPDWTPRATLPALPGPIPALAKISHYNSLVFSPDGRYLAAVRNDLVKSDLYVWDLRDSAASRHWARIDAAGADISFRNDGRTLAYSARGTKVGIIDLHKGGEPRTINLPLPIAGGTPDPSQSQLGRIAWSPSSAVLAMACTNATGQGSIVFWDTDRQAELDRWDGNFTLLGLRIAFSTDGKRLAESDASGAIRIYDIAAQREVLRLEDVHSSGRGLLQWTADGRLLSAADIGTSVTIWEPSRESLSSILVPGKDFVTHMTFSPDGRRLCLERITTQGHTVTLIERDSGQTVVQLPSVNFLPTTLRFRPNGQQVALFGMGKVAVYDLPTARTKAYPQSVRPGWKQWPNELSFLADGRLLTVEVMEKEREVHLTVRDMFSGQEAGPAITAPFTGESNSFPVPHLSPDGRLLLGFSGVMLPSKDEIAIWDVASGARVGELSSPDVGIIPMGSARLSADGRWLCYKKTPSNQVMGLDASRVRLRIWDVANRRHYWDVGISEIPSCFAMSPDGRLLAVGYENGSVELWDIAAKELLFQWRALDGRVVQWPFRAGATILEFTPDADFLAVSGATAPVHLLHIGDLRRRLADMGLDW